ncbi:MAG: phosphogluconate dehydrogenase (NAD(+)-dependent, decarboxylating) [Planctomycetota bacterium]
MQVGMVGLGRMGANLVRRLRRHGHECVGHDRDPALVAALVAEGVRGAASPAELAASLDRPRVAWLMVPAAAVDPALAALVPHLAAGDVVIDGGNSHFADDQRRARELAAAGLHYVDIGTSGGVVGLERGFCLMIGGEAETVARLAPLFAALAPGVEAAPRTPGRAARPVAPAERGWLHCGPAGAGHFVKMVHNGIEYGVMAALAEGLNLLRHGAAGGGEEGRRADAETAPLAHPERYRYDLPLAEVAEVWRRGSVISSWLLDLAADALARDPALAGFAGRVADSGEGRWTVQAAVELGVPAPVLTTALYERFASRGEAEFARRVLSAMRKGFGGHEERAGGSAR